MFLIFSSAKSEIHYYIVVQTNAMEFKTYSLLKIIYQSIVKACFKNMHIPY